MPTDIIERNRSVRAIGGGGEYAASVAGLIKLDDRCLRVTILSVIGTTSDD